MATSTFLLPQNVRTICLTYIHTFVPSGIIKVSSGWSHIVARGVDVDGRLVFYSWGRRDMNQYVVDGMRDLQPYY